MITKFLLSALFTLSVLFTATLTQAQTYTFTIDNSGYDLGSWYPWTGGPNPQSIAFNYNGSPLPWWSKGQKVSFRVTSPELLAGTNGHFVFGLNYKYSHDPIGNHTMTVTVGDLCNGGGVRFEAIWLTGKGFDPVCAALTQGLSSVLIDFSADINGTASVQVWNGDTQEKLGSRTYNLGALFPQGVAIPNFEGFGFAMIAPKPSLSVTVDLISHAMLDVLLEPAPRLINLSTRGQVQTGDNVMIGGFVIGGASPKTVLIRAVGPNLANFGVQGVLANPTLQLFSGQTVIANNDNWGSAANAAAIQATGLAPANSLESAILATLTPGAYTAIVSGVGGSTGVGIVEVFEIDKPYVPLINLSTRGRVETGDNVMIGGFVIQGTTPQTVLIRAVGPNLANFGVPGVLANPMLQLFSGQTVIASNDNWQSASNAGGIQATGLAPANWLESAILVTLAPGAYTAIVSGVGGGTGVGIVEVFAQ